MVIQFHMPGMHNHYSLRQHLVGCNPLVGCEIPSDILKVHTKLSVIS